MRTFISIDIPEKLHSKIKNIQRALPKFTGRMTELKDMHLTLKFLGEVSEDKIGEIKKCLKTIKLKKFHAKLSEIGVFSEHCIKIIWLGIEGTEEFQKAIDNCLKHLFQLETRFMSHLTIARVKHINKKYQKEFLEKINKLRLNEEFLVDKFKLKKSELFRSGSQYKDLEVYELE